MGNREKESANDVDFVFSLVEEIAKVRDAECVKLPYHINIIDELHADENAHTRILLKLLKFSDNGTWPFLRGFIAKLNEISGEKIEIGKYEGVTIEFNRDNIDGLIQFADKNKTAIVIENKINWAVDQPKQIERYVKLLRDEGASVFVVYLTSDGNKIVSDESLTAKAKDWLDYTDGDPGRFKVMNYRDHILPLVSEWLKSSGSKEGYLESCLTQYHDYLKGRFGKREEEKEMNEKLKSTIKQKLNLKDSLSLKERKAILEGFEHELQVFRTALDSVREELDSKIDQWAEKSKKTIVKWIEEWGAKVEREQGIKRCSEKVDEDKLFCENKIESNVIGFSFALNKFVRMGFSGQDFSNWSDGVVWYGLYSEARRRDIEGLIRKLNKIGPNERDRKWLWWDTEMLGDFHHPLQRMFDFGEKNCEKQFKSVLDAALKKMKDVASQVGLM